MASKLDAMFDNGGYTHMTFSRLAMDIARGWPQKQTRVVVYVVADLGRWLARGCVR